MTGQPFDANALPHGLSEADLLEWVEADTRARRSAAPGSAVDRVGLALESDPQLKRMLEAMRIDRAALGSMETPAPPASLAQAVLEEHERQALLALSDIATLGPRAAQHRADDDEPFAWSAMPGWFKPALAVAAAAALAFGAWQLVPVLLPNPRSTGPAATPDSMVAQGDDVPEPMPKIVVDPINEAPALVTEAPPPMMQTPKILRADAGELLVARLDMPYEFALEMAEAGRLMVVVAVDELGPVEDAVVSISRRPVEASWRLDEPPIELIAALSEPTLRRSGVLDRGRDGPRIAEGDGPLGRLEMIMAATPSVYVARVSSSAEALLSLLEAMDRLGSESRVVVTTNPLPSAGAVSAPISEDVVLWWERDPASWQPWAAVPIRFVETQ